MGVQNHLLKQSPQLSPGRPPLPWPVRTSAMTPRLPKPIHWENPCRQAHPLVNAYTTAVNTARSSHGAVPLPCGRAANDGSNGATSS